MLRSLLTLQEATEARAAALGASAARLHPVFPLPPAPFLGTSGFWAAAASEEQPEGSSCGAGAALGQRSSAHRAPQAAPPH